MNSPEMSLKDSTRVTILLFLSGELGLEMRECELSPRSLPYSVPRALHLGGRGLLVECIGQVLLLS